MFKKVLSMFSASQEDPQELYELGHKYYAGEGGFRQNYRKAAKFLKKAAKQGNAEAQRELAKMYEHGKGVPIDYSEAIALLSEAAEKDGDYPFAATQLLFLFEEGRGSRKEYAKAIKFFESLAENGLIKAQYAAGTMYYEGAGVPRDFSKAGRYLKAPAQQGYKRAEKMFYSLGQGERGNDYYTKVIYEKQGRNKIAYVKSGGLGDGVDNKVIRELGKVPILKRTGISEKDWDKFERNPDVITIS